jgi:prepilin-type N-terminal cleavage/methylation domain-containing protein
MAARPVSRSRHPAFTLVELLVVIGIIALLVSILLPVLGKARAQASAVACQSNMRQLAAAFLLFAHDHGGCLPGGESDRPIEWQNDWAIGTYDCPSVGARPDLFPMAGTLWPYVNSVGAYRCPALHFHQYNSGDGSNGVFDYSSPRIFMGAKLVLIPQQCQMKSGTYVENVATPMLLEESPAWALNNVWTEPSWCSTDRLSYIHRMGTHIAGIDGHVYWYKPPAHVTPAANLVHIRCPSGKTMTMSKANSRWGDWNTW